MIDWKKVRRRRAIIFAVDWALRNAVWCYLFYAALWSLFYSADAALKAMGVG